MVSSLPLIVGWLLLSHTQSLPLWYLSRFLSGLSNGASYTVLPVYLAEIASAPIRGCISVMFTVLCKGGILFVYIVAPEVSIATMSYICIGLVAGFLAIFVWMPESPYYQLAQGNSVAALRSLSILRRHHGGDTITNELRHMQDATTNHPRQTIRGTFRLILHKSNRKALLLMLAIGAQIQLCGSQAIVCNSKMIFEHFSSGGWSSNNANIALGCIQVVSALVASSVVDYFGRRPLLLAGVVATGLSNGVIAAYFWAGRVGFDVSALGWIPMVMVFVFIVFYTIGLSSVFTVLVSELFAKDVRSMAVALATMHSTLLAAVVTALFQELCDDLGPDVTFGMFFGCSALSFGYLWRRMPETKGTRLDHVQRQFET